MSHPDRSEPSGDPRPSDAGTGSGSEDWADRTQVLPPGAFGATGQGSSPETDLSAPAAAPPSGSDVEPQSSRYSGASTSGGWSPASGSSPYAPGRTESPSSPSGTAGSPSGGSGYGNPSTTGYAGPAAAASSRSATESDYGQPSASWPSAGQYESEGNERFADRTAFLSDQRPASQPEPASNGAEAAQRPYPASGPEPDAPAGYSQSTPQGYGGNRPEAESGYAEPPRQPYPASGPTQTVRPDFSSRSYSAPSDGGEATVSYPAGLLSSAGEPKQATAPQPVSSLAPAGTPYGASGYGAPPAYAPTGPEPGNYQQPVPPPQSGAGPAPTDTVRPAPPASRAPIAAIMAVIGIVLVGVGVFLAARYGFNFTVSQHLGTTDKILAALGGLAIFVAIVLNGLSFWATLIPGLALTAVGAWAAVSVSGAAHLRSWLKFALPAPDLDGWRLLAWTGALGVVLLGSSIAAAIARGGGRRFGVLATKAAQPAPSGRSTPASGPNRY